MKERNVLKEEATKLQDEKLMAEYRRIRNKVSRDIKSDQKEYYKHQFPDSTISPKKAWKLVYEVLGKVKDKSPSKIRFKDKIISNPKALADAFNTIFKNKVD